MINASRSFDHLKTSTAAKASRRHSDRRPEVIDVQPLNYYESSNIKHVIHIAE
jgi:hypothetical protein